MSYACAELIARCFAARTAAHYLHFRANSYAQHVALDGFYTELLDATDRFAECHMGVEGQFKKFPTVPLQQDLSPTELLTDLHDWVTKHRTECADGSTELANLIDEILAVIDRSFYKLKFLK
ncbi:MAG TPA: DUF5856 family protein [Thermomonas sp.]|mgnify:CR=1 FL=1|nr:DUF5856 family protein [Thermomonas sp.]